MNFTFFLKCTRNLLQGGQILGHKSSLGKFKKIESIISSIFSDHNTVRLEVNYREKKKTIKEKTNIRKRNKMLLNNQQITEEIKKEI